MTQSAERPFDLVILDVDGTIYEPTPDHANDDFTGGFDPQIAATIAAVQAAGIPVTIASGRTLEFIHKHLAPMGITVPCVTTQGAVIGDPVTGDILHRFDIQRAEARDLAAWVDAGDRLCAFYFVDEHGRNTIVENLRTPANPYYDAIIGVPRHFEPSFSALLEADDAELPVKLLMVSDMKEEPGLPAELQARFGPGVHVGRTHPSLCEITSAGVDKGSGVAHLLEMLQIDPARVLAVGDNDNDVPMFRQVGFPVAMANGSMHAKEAARWIAPNIHASGASRALRHLVLGEE
jgi:Cof subfamily protein (haloacid dehalogenase superfamily)